MSAIVPKDASENAEVKKHLIDKAFDFLGWVFTHDTPKRIAVKDYIAEIEKSDFSPLHKAALKSRAKKDIKEYSYQLQIVNGSVVYLQPSAKPENLEDDWLAQFFDKTRLVSDEEFQEIWSRLLAEECNNPGSIPKYAFSSARRNDIVFSFPEVAFTGQKVALRFTFNI